MYQSTTVGRDNLFADIKPDPIPSEVKIKADSGLYVRGTVLGEITAAGHCVIVNSGNADGSEKPYAILSEDIDTTGAASDIVAVAFMAGSYQENALVFGGADTAVTHKAELRDKNIYVK